jgi:hypothetical protein
MGRRRTGYHQGERVVRTLICREVMTQMRGARRLIGVA